MAEKNLLAHVLVPVSYPEDAKKTAVALAEYEPLEITALHVIQKGKGSPEKMGISEPEQYAKDCFAVVREVFPDVNTKTAYSTDIAQAIFDAADEVDASAIAYRSRGGNRLLQYLSGDISLKLVTKASRPVIALPRESIDQ